ncbi:Similar to S.cerevisiae protein SEC11 (18kDa catalytic subunit of the Signal Peptidase Complex (SPC)) [Malassezia sympodialis ATCC 42132]|uniref:Signal peptidase complex catalytic subunit SEC11 n=1 Tax=Malassezia sympodialis (strain ATCC 42132) TaxID=1230383 RepID=A0A1M8A1U0_MALS4|nr:Similar to S.cerevisiae protein SEC11 (18kDa catalytic subunit of the Signal Peptidase Complex (SPC)) [Malassezia sympodialis ATCC 42132]
MFASQAQALQPHMWRRQVAQFVQVLHVIAMALAVWKGLSVVTNTESPVVVVLSGSMEPAFHRGDLLFLTMTSKPIEPGEITVYRVPNTDIPIVHRVIEARDNGRRGQLLLTKGDNNEDDDIMLYQGPRWIRDDQIVGRVQGFLPYAGYITILLNDYPALKYVVLSLLGLSLFFERE